MPELDPTTAVADPSAMVAKMMEDLGRTNPQMAMLAQLMQSRTPAAPPDDDTDVIDELTARLAEAEAQLDLVRRQGRKLFAVHQEARERLTSLAAALGACGLCWGDDPRCPSCRGRGRPGMVRPDLELRTQLLGPRRPRVAEPL